MAVANASLNFVSPADPCVGDLIARKYRLIRTLGEGGMGTVWLARHEVLETNVAIKLLRANLQVPDVDARFEREARAAAVVEHPAIVRVLDFGRREDGLPFIVMQPLDGETLSARLERGPLPPAEAVRLLLPIADALSHAHEKGVVHRDLKPENIFLARENGVIAPKLLDFGIAKLPREESGANLTRRGMVLGTVSYMAPEQARGLLDVDYRSDIWALSVVLYEAISGTVPFRGDSFHATLKSIIEDDVPPLNRAPSDDSLWAILSRGLAKDRRDRCPSMREFGDGLAAWLRTHGVVGDDATRAELEQTWGGKEGAFANGPMHAPAWSATAPAVPLLMPKKKRRSPVLISRTELNHLRRMQVPRFAWVMVAGAALMGVAWSSSGFSDSQPSAAVAQAAQAAQVGQHTEHTRHTVTTIPPISDAKMAPEPGAPIVQPTVAPKAPTSIDQLPLAPSEDPKPVAALPRRPAKVLVKTEKTERRDLAPMKVVLPEEPSPAASVTPAAPEEDTGSVSGGWLRRALVGGPAAKARANH